MEDFEKIKSICVQDNEISREVIDDFLIYYVAARYNMEREMNRIFALYSHVTREFQEEWVAMLKAQYIAHKIFKHGGLIRKLLNHRAMQDLSEEEKRFLQKQTRYPWRFSFSEIIDIPAEEFFVMRDVFSEEKFLLYSPGTKKILKEHGISLWFNLIAYNGACWVTYGPIAHYSSFDADDIYFFATEHNPYIEFDEEVMEDVERNPVPYMMLLSGARYPVFVHKKDIIVHNLSEFDLDDLDGKTLSDGFKREYNQGVYWLKLKRWGNHPHFSQAYYDEKNKIILLHAMTDRGYHALVRGLNKYGYDFPEFPSIRVKPSMIETAEFILKKKITLNEYEELFSVETNEEDKEIIDKLNVLLKLALPAINAGESPDIEALAKKTGVDVETARDLIEQAIKKFEDLERKKGV